MHLTLFKPDEHYEMLSEWRKKRNLESMSIDGFPKTGLIVYEKEKPILASFLYDTDSYWIFIDGTISDPDTTREERNNAVDMVLDGLLELAKFKEKRIIATYISQKHIGKALKEHEFVKAGEAEFFMRGV